MTGPRFYIDFEQMYAQALRAPRRSPTDTVKAPLPQPTTPQERLDTCVEIYMDKRWIPKADFVWMSTLVQAAINATQHGNTDEIFKTLKDMA